MCGDQHGVRLQCYYAVCAAFSKRFKWLMLMCSSWPRSTLLTLASRFCTQALARFVSDALLRLCLGCLTPAGRARPASGIKGSNLCAPPACVRLKGRPVHQAMRTRPHDVGCSACIGGPRTPGNGRCAKRCLLSLAGQGQALRRIGRHRHAHTLLQAARPHLWRRHLRSQRALQPRLRTHTWGKC